MAPKKGMKVNNKNRGVTTRKRVAMGANLNAMRQLVRMPATQIPQTVKMGDAAMRYAHALVSPFSKEAEGVRIPEPYAISTVVRKVHVPIVLTSSAGGGLDFSVQPHLFASFWQTLGGMSGGAAANTPANIPAALTSRSAVTFSTIQSLYQNYRIVAIGVRVKTNVDFTRSGGRIYGAVLPATQEVPFAFASGVSLANALGCLEIPNDGTNVTTNILNLPRGFQFTVSELMSEGGCEVHFPICSARAMDFLDGQSQNQEQHLTITSGAGLEVATTGLGVCQTAGHSQFVLRGEGLNASTDVLTAEVIYHVEGVPLVGSANLVESTPHTPAPSSPNEIHMAHRIAAAAPVVAYVRDKLSAAARNGGGMARAAGAAERVLGIAVRGLTLA